MGLILFYRNYSYGFDSILKKIKTLKHGFKVSPSHYSVGTGTGGVMRKNIGNVSILYLRIHFSTTLRGPFDHVLAIQVPSLVLHLGELGTTVKHGKFIKIFR